MGCQLWGSRDHTNGGVLNQNGFFTEMQESVSEGLNFYFYNFKTHPHSRNILTSKVLTPIQSRDSHIFNNRFAGCDLDRGHVLSNRFEHPSFRESCKTSVETKKLKKTHLFFIKCVFIGKETCTVRVDLSL